MRILEHLLRDEAGQDMVEYALLSGLIAVAVGAILPPTVVPVVSHIFSRANSVLLRFS
jgi:Flp pilus assembly pilin Flp